MTPALWGNSSRWRKLRYDARIPGEFIMADWQHRYARINGIDMHYVEQGQGQSPRPRCASS